MSGEGNEMVSKKMTSEKKRWRWLYKIEIRKNDVEKQRPQKLNCKRRCLKDDVVSQAAQLKELFKVGCGVREMVEKGQERSERREEWQV